MAGLIAMVSVFFVVTIEMFFSTMNGGSMGGCHGGGGISSSGYEVLTPTTTAFPHRRTLSSTSTTASLRNSVPGARASLNMSRAPARTRRSGSIGHQLQRIELHAGGAQYPDVFVSDGDGDYPKNTESDGYEEGDSEDSEATEMQPINARKRSTSESHERGQHGGGRLLTDEQQQRKNLLQVMLLEAGILFHSVFIGMALSVATGSNFIVLLIAITFHRTSTFPAPPLTHLTYSVETFEGLALGSRIAGITAFPKGSLKPWLMCLAYGTTTPIGQAIGLLTRNLYDPASQTGLLMVGIMNAISSGLLLFAGLVELLAEDFLSDESYFILNGRRRLQACAAVAAGAAGMALVGAWA